MLIECKSHNIKINESVFEQVLNYQKKVQAIYMLVTNGEKHFCFRITKDKPVFLEDIPSYTDLVN